MTKSSVKKNLTDKKKIRNRDQNMTMLLWGMTAVVTVFCFLTMLYHDSLVNSNIGYRIIDTLFSGTFLEFFNQAGWSYGLSIYSIYAVWSIPVWVIGKIAGTAVNMNAIGVLLWYKLLPALFGLWSVYLIGEIAGLACPWERKNEVRLQYTCSVLFLFPVFAIAQCDSMGTCFALLGLYYFIKEDNRKFILFFAIACTMKYFALFVFIPLLLLRYKRLDKLILVMLGGGSLVGISTFIISLSKSGNHYMHDADFYVNQHISGFADVALEVSSKRSIGLLGLLFVIVCIMAYATDESRCENKAHYAIWAALSGYACFFLGYVCNFYWYVILVPFFILTAFQKPRYLGLNLLLELGFGVSTCLAYIYLQSWVFLGQKTYSYLFLKSYAEGIQQNALMDLSEQLFHTDLRPYVPLFHGIAYGCMIGFLVLNHPGILKSNSTERIDRKDYQMITLLRILVLFAWIGISFVSFPLIGTY